MSSLWDKQPCGQLLNMGHPPGVESAFQGGVRIFDAGVNILIHGHQIQHDAQWRASKMVCSWRRVKILMPRRLCETPNGLQLSLVPWSLF